MIYTSRVLFIVSVTQRTQIRLSTYTVYRRFVNYTTATVSSNVFSAS